MRSVCDYVMSYFRQPVNAELKDYDKVTYLQSLGVFRLAYLPKTEHGRKIITDLQSDLMWKEGWRVTARAVPFVATAFQISLLSPWLIPVTTAVAIYTNRYAHKQADDITVNHQILADVLMTDFDAKKMSDKIKVLSEKYFFTENLKLITAYVPKKELLETDSSSREQSNILQELYLDNSHAPKTRSGDFPSEDTGSTSAFDEKFEDVSPSSKEQIDLNPLPVKNDVQTRRRPRADSSEMSKDIPQDSQAKRFHLVKED